MNFTKDRILLMLCLIVIFIVGFLPIKDTDFGWHYRCGKQIITGNKPCLDNTFSYYLSSYKAYYSSFFSDLSIATIYDFGGKFVGLSLFGSLLFVISALFFIFTFPQISIFISTFAFGLIFWLSSGILNLGIRSQNFTFTFFIILLFLIKRSDYKKRFKLILFPLLFFIWVNTHIGFFVGFVPLGLFFLQSLIECKNRIKILIILFASFLATLINPFGVKIYWEIFRHAITPLNTLIAEWVTPNFYMQVLIIVSSVSIVILFRSLLKKNMFVILLLIFTAILALSARRNLPLFWTVILYSFLQTPFSIRHFSKMLDEKYPAIFGSILVTLILIFSAINVPKTIVFDTSWLNYCSKGLYGYPCQAIKDYPKLYGNVFATYEWGGFLIWQKPEIKVFVDGRMPAWKGENNKSPYQTYLEIIQTQPGWNETLSKYKTDFLLISQGTFLDLLLEKEAKKYHWQEVYRKGGVVIYKNFEK